MKTITIRDFDGIKMSVENFLSCYDKLPRTQIYLRLDNNTKIRLSVDDLKKHMGKTGSFIYFEDDDGEWDNRRIIRKELWFVI